MSHFWATEVAYPSPRRRRNGAAAAPVEAGAPPPAPRVRYEPRHWVFYTQIANNAASRVVSPRYRGPALIKSLMLAERAGGSSSLMTLRLVISPSGGGAVKSSIGNPALAVLQPGDRVVWESSAANVNSAVTPRSGFWVDLGAGGGGLFPFVLNEIVHDTEFHLALDGQDEDAASSNVVFTGHVYLIQSIDLEQLPALLAG